MTMTPWRCGMPSSDDRYALPRKPRPPHEIKLEQDQAQKLYDILWWIAFWLFMISMNTSWPCK